MSASDAIALSTRLNEIGFPEFTCKLINDVFDAVISANLRQTEAYLELVKSVSKDLTTFINDTKDSIGGDLIFQFLVKVLPDPNSNAGTFITSDNTNTLTTNQANAINDAVSIPNVPTSLPANTSTPINNLYDDILKAAAKRISADKYEILKEMVSLGILRLVVEDGEIETKLTFTTYGSSFYEQYRTNYNRKDFNLSANAKTGGFLSNWIKASASSSFSNVNISTATISDKDNTGSSVQIFGGVKIKFKTDYKPLA
ncbi:MAG: hypothetical protein ACRC30_03380 [Clostridium sp.]